MIAAACLIVLGIQRRAVYDKLVRKKCDGGANRQAVCERIPIFERRSGESDCCVNGLRFFDFKADWCSMASVFSTSKPIGVFV